MSPEHKKRFEEIEAVTLPILRLAIHGRFGMPMDRFDDIDVDMRPLSEAGSEVTGRWLKSLFELHGVYEDMLVCLQVSESFPWKEEEVGHSRYLHFCWSQFVNLCYLFREKTKKFCNDSTLALQSFDKDAGSIDTAAVLKLVDADLKAFIRARGEHWHEWNVGHAGVRDLRTIETLRAVGKWPDDFPDFETFYVEARDALCGDIDVALEAMAKILLGVVNKVAPPLLVQVERFSEALLKARELSRSDVGKVEDQGEGRASSCSGSR